MLVYLTHRLLASIPVLLAASLLVFLMLFLGGGDPAVRILGPEADAETLGRFRAELGLDRPLVLQYFDWLSKVVRGDLGRTVGTVRVPVSELIIQRVPVTLELAVLSMLISLAIAAPLGILAATHRNSWIDLVAAFVAQLGISLPSFLVGLLLIYVFAIQFRLVPPTGFVPLFQDPAGNLRSILLPSVTLGFAMAATVTRMLRSSLIEVLEQDFIRTARAKGLAERAVVSRHALKNAALPVVTVVGLQMGHLLGGAVVVETVFALPGIGKLGLDAILVQNFPVVQGVVLLMAVGFLVLNLVVDLMYAQLNPRIRYE